jgi:photosystem II stability/assembly factor-like uncharacterized protein
MPICLSHSGKTMFASDEPAKEMLVGTANGVLFLHRNSVKEPWEIVKGALEGNHVVALTIEPASGTIFASAHNGGIRASTDGGKSWQPRSKGIPFENVYCLNCSCFGGQVKLYAGTEPAHLYVSQDLGITWEEITSLLSVPSKAQWTFPVPPHEGHVKDITIHPRNPDVFYVCVEQGGVFRTRDGGKSWQELHHALQNDDCHRVVIVPSNPQNIFLPTGYGFYWSTDGGDTWENIGQRIPRLAYPDPFVINPRDDSLIFMSGASASPHSWLTSRSADPKIARSCDGGLTWEIVDRGLPSLMNANFEAMTIEAWKNGCAVYAGNTDGQIWCSFDQGTSWQKVAEGLPPISKTIHYTILRPEAGTEGERTTVGGISLVSRYQYE